MSEEVKEQVKQEVSSWKLEEQNNKLQKELEEAQGMIKRQSNEIGEGVRPLKEENEKLKAQLEELTKSPPAQDAGSDAGAKSDDVEKPVESPPDRDWDKEKQDLIRSISKEEQERIDEFYKQLTPEQQTVTDTAEGFVTFIDNFRGKQGPLPRTSLFGEGTSTTPQDTINKINEQVSAIFEKAEVETINSVPRLRPSSPHSLGRNNAEQPAQERKLVRHGDVFSHLQMKEQK